MGLCGGYSGTAGTVLDAILSRHEHVDRPLAGALLGKEGVPLVAIVTVLGADPGKGDDAAPQVMRLGTWPHPSEGPARVEI